MSEDRNPMERLLERAARRLSGAGLHPIELLQAIEDAWRDSARDGLAANGVVVHLAPGDFAAFRDDLPRLQAAVQQMLGRVARERGWRIEGEWAITIEPRAAVGEGHPHVRAFFAQAQAPGEGTRAIRRHRETWLRIDGGERNAVLFTPWRIGRGPENDLVLPGLAVSRRHAELRFEGGQFVLVDLGSRNGIEVEGERVPAVVLTNGLIVRLGDIDLTFEHGR